MNRTDTIRIWDPLVRLFHWSLVLAFVVAYVTEDDLLGPHVWAGYVIGGLLLFRLIWGVIGSRYARFSDFVRRPSVAVQYLKEMASGRAKRYLGHNPAGGLMIVVLLLSLTITVLSGLAVYGIDGSGPAGFLTAGLGSLGKDLLEEGHELFANLTLLLVLLHLAGVAAGSLLHRENLVKAMVSGDKQA